MKKLIIAALATTVAVGAFAQGTVNFNNRVTGTITTHVFGPEVGNTTTSIIGNMSTDFPVGSTIYTGAALQGGGYYAQLFAANGANVAESLLVAAQGTTTFRTGTGAGFVAPPALATVLNGVPLDAAVATLQMRVWDNSSGNYPTWALAQTAWEAGLIAAGKSLPFNVNAIGGVLNTAPNLVGLQSFNIYTTGVVVVPEPSTFALAGLGLAGLMIFRRRK